MRAYAPQLPRFYKHYPIWSLLRTFICRMSDLWERVAGAVSRSSCYSTAQAARFSGNMAFCGGVARSSERRHLYANILIKLAEQVAPRDLWCKCCSHRAPLLIGFWCKESARFTGAKRLLSVSSIPHLWDQSLFLRLLAAKSRRRRSCLPFRFHPPPPSHRLFAAGKRFGAGLRSALCARCIGDFVE